MTDFDNILKTIKETTDTEADTYQLISSKETVKLKPMTLGQQKEILSSTLVDTTKRLNNNAELTRTIIENQIDGPAIRTVDREYILLQMKSTLTNGDLTIYVDEAPITIDLKQHLGECKNKIDKINFTHEYTLSGDNITVNCEIPSLTTELEYTELANEEYDPQSSEDESEEAQKAIELAYLTELAKHIKTIVIGKETIDFKSSVMTFSQKLEILEALPYILSSKISNKMMEFVEKYGFIVSINTPSGEKYQLEIDNQLFGVE